MKNKFIWMLPLLAATLLAVGCAGQKEPATKAVADIEASLTSIRADAEKYAPGELQQADQVVASLKDMLTKKDYKSVVAAAPGISQQIAALQQTVATKRSEMEAVVAAASQQWQTLSADVPKMVEAIQSRVDILSKARKLPQERHGRSIPECKGWPGIHEERLDRGDRAVRGR